MEPQKHRSESLQDTQKVVHKDTQPIKNVEPSEASKPAEAKYVLVSPQLAACTTQTQSKIVVGPQPLNVKVDSDTDWLAVLVTPLAIAIAASIFTVFSNRQQIRSNTANYRHTWQIDLRNALVSYVSAAQQLLTRAVTDSRFPLKQEAESLRSELMSAQNTVALMLDTDKPYAKRLKQEMLRTNRAIFSVPPQLDDGTVSLDEVIASGQSIIERAWKDIRRDLHHSEKT